MQDQSLQIETRSNIIDNNFVSNIKITPPKLQGARPGVAIICVLDISASMDCEATQGQSTESDGFSRLDLVKHSVNTIIETLQDQDMLGVVTFSDKARTDLNLTKMNKDGKTKASKKISEMKTEGCTNLWDGIKTGLQLSKSPECSQKNVFVVVLSDGEPNQHPPGGELKALQNFLKENELTCNLSMFGYGYNLDTKLLSAITTLGGGCYGYIPDCSMVGTIFVNFLSHALAAFSSLMAIEIKTLKGKLIELNEKKPEESRALLGSAQYGFTRNCFAKFSDISDGDQVAQITVRYGKGLRRSERFNLSASNVQQNDEINIQKLRYSYIKFLEQATQQATQGDMKAASINKDKLLAQMNQLNGKINDEYLNSLIRDIKSDNENEGQVGIGLESMQFWKKWGKHYFPALKIAHTIQMCTNFKDPGIQGYASDLFRDNESKIDTIFIKLPPPTPSIKKYDAKGQVKNAKVQNMAAYYNCGGGCIHGDCTVETIDGTVKPIKSLNKGDSVKNHLGGYSTIKCVLTTNVGTQIQMVKFQSGLIITNYHPVFYQGKWQFPVQAHPSEKVFIDKYYNFVMDSDHSMLVNGMYCITLGHGYINDKVLAHEYLGTSKVIDDLSKAKGWNEGNVVLSMDMIKRDSRTNKIIGIDCAHRAEKAGQEEKAVVEMLA